MSEQAPTTRFVHTTAIGGNGGHTFQLETPGQLVKYMEVASENDRLRGINLILTDGAHDTFGVMSGSKEIFEFEFGEKIDQLQLFKSSYRDGRSGGFYFKTNKGRIFQVGPREGAASQLQGGYLGGLFGRCGADIDQLGFSYANDVADYYLTNVKYDVVSADASAVRPTALDTGVLINKSKRSQKMSYVKTLSVSRTKSWTSQLSIKAGVTAKGKAGVPFVAEGEVAVSAEVGFSYNWGGSEAMTSSETVQVGPIDVEPGKMYRIVARADSGNLSVPYTATALLTYQDGTSLEQPEKGVFEGITVGVIQAQLIGPFDADPKLAALESGEHEVTLRDQAYPNLTSQTVLVK